MINIIEVFEGVVENWNDDNFCDNCWTFEYVQFESELNKSIPDTEGECCAVVFLTDYQIRPTRSFASGLSGVYISDFSIDHNFTLKIYEQDQLGVNIYKEQKGHCVNESRWNKILQPKLDCLIKEDFLSLCEHLGRNVQVTNEVWTPVIVQHDYNYTGWSIQLTIREYNVSQI